MNLKRIAYLAVALLFVFKLAAQQSLYHESGNNDYRTGLELYQNGKYSAAQQFFDRYTETHTKSNSEQATSASYYSAMCAMKLFNRDAEQRLLKFLNDNPENPLSNDAVFNLANYFYQQKSYNNALDYYERVNVEKLSGEDLASYYFMAGYCYFLRDDVDRARFFFSQIKDSDTRYTPPALYYYSHINYAQGNYETAAEGFRQLTGDVNFGPIVPYYLAQIYFKQQKYDEVLKYVPPLLEKASESRVAELSRIIGESYAELGRYKEALPYLERYLKSGTSLSNEDKYAVAWVYYKTADFKKAADLFSQVSSSNNALSQNALYHLGDCHLKLGEKDKARMSFASASKMEFDDGIRQDALLNFALLTYELDYSPFNEAIQALNDYLELYPNSPRSDEASNYLVMAYLNAKNYKLALASIDKIRNKDNEIKLAFQKIAYFRGLELLSNLNYREAISLFKNSVQYGILDKKFYALSLYWTGEAYYRLGEYIMAGDHYTSFLAQPGVSAYNEYPVAHYNLGYSYYNQKKYADARIWFSKYTSLTKGTSPVLLADSYNRMGDCYLAQMDYARAISSYDNAARQGTGNTDYAMYQKGLTQGIAGRDAEKLSTLSQMLKSYPNSSLKADATYQMAESYMKLKQNDRAISTFNQIIKDYPSSSYVNKSLLNLGLLYFNTDQTADAIRCYKEVISRYPGSDEAQDALLGLKNVYLDMGQSDVYFDYVKEMGILTSEDLKEQDALSFASAEKLYMSGDYAKAAQSLDNYIKNHKDGRFLLQAYFYKGDCHYRAGENEMALAAFDYVIRQPKNTYTEQALLGASRIKFRQKDYNAAATYYSRLEEVAEVKSNLLESRLGMMRCYYQLEEYEKVNEVTDRILLSERLSPDQERETLFLKAKSFQARDRLMLALEEYKKVAKEVISAEGAESKYQMAAIYYQRKETDNAEKEISDFADKTTPHQYWMAKSFLLWADIFRDRGDDFQAIQTLQSLIDYYENEDDGIIREAEAKRKALADKQEKVAKPADEKEIEVEL